VDHVVHWYQINQKDTDTFLRSVYTFYDYHYYQGERNRDKYQWYCEITLYYRGTTIPLNLSNSRLYHNPEYRLQFRQSSRGEFGFWPSTIEFWDIDLSHGVWSYRNVRTILNGIITGVLR
jgi:hypothetical protein